MAKTSIIILTYNQLDYTKMCIDSIRRFTQTEYEIIVVDNASSDGTPDWLRAQKDITAIFNDTNRGFPAGCNQGILKSTGDVIVLLNNDTLVTEHWLDNMLRCFASSPQIGAVGPATNSPSYYQQLLTTYDERDREAVFAFGRQVSLEKAGSYKERIMLTGFCLAVRKEVVDKIGLLDEMFTPGYAEDDDYCFRVIKAGYKVVFCEDAFVHHFGNVSFAQLQSKPTEMIKNFNLDTVNDKFKKKWGFHRTYHTNIRQDVLKELDVSDTGKSIRVLEIGCGCGGTLLEIRNIFPSAELFGIERNECAGGIAANFASVKTGDVETMEFDYPENFFDYIFLLDVLEHLVDPWTLLAKLRKYLKPGGKIWASIPNVMHFSIILELLKGKWEYTDEGILDKTHLRFFTLSTIMEMFKEGGYTIDKTIGNATDYEDAQKFLEYLHEAVAPKKRQELIIVQYLVCAAPDSRLGS